MPKLSVIIHTLVSRLLLVLMFVVMAIPFILVMLLPARVRRTNWFVFRLMDWIYRFSLWSMFVPVTIEGKENIPNEPCIFVANHQSSLDIPLLGSIVHGHPHLWLARSELMDTFFLRLVLPLFSIVIDVNNPHKAMRALIRTINIVKKEKQHLMVFPEGGRYTDGQIHEFFGGFGILALKTGYPVVPARILGVDKIYPPDSFWINRHPIKAVIGKPFRCTDGQDSDVLRQEVYHWFVTQEE